ncbi:hypothetical protein GCM10009001_00020 [Virgibacillus siamensis]|uniref:Uncharacterized protein n=1 Tax=Virgibacillus siamensis TaxID=480071 RepID=A0ABN1FCU7_9BACI
MKFLISKICFILLLFLTTTVTINAAEDTVKVPSPKQLLEFNEDLTGDGRKESIVLKGVKFSMETDYLKDAWVEIQLENNKKRKIPYDGGYNPNLEFLDLNHDKVLDIFYRSEGQGGLHNQALHTLSNGELKEIQLPVQRYVKAYFTDGFRLEVKLSPEQKPYITNVKKRASDYIQKGIYNKQGKLLTDGSVVMEPINRYEPVFINKQKGYGLKSYQQINGTGHTDTIGSIETLWYYENDNWLILKTKWIPSR